MERDTRQRRAIREVFEAQERPLSPQEVLDTARGRVAGMGIATVYRTLKGLVGERWLVPVELPGETTRYERAGKEHHHHFHCRDCGRVYEMDGCPKDLKRLAPRGFVVDAHEVVLYGSCAECAKGV